MKSLLISFAVLVCAISSLAALSEPTKNKAKARQQAFMEEQRKEMSAVAVTIARQLGVDLDYSLESIKRLDDVLERYHQILEQGREIPYPEALMAQFGMYLIVTIEKNYGKGIVESDDPDEGPGSLPFTWHSKKMFPSQWCQKRINEGKSASVWKVFRGYFPEDEKKKEANQSPEPTRGAGPVLLFPSRQPRAAHL